MNNDAVTIAPHMHKVVFENDKVRVLEVSVKPKDKAEMHGHPENMVYVIKPGLLRFTNQQGEVNDANLEAGQITSSGENFHEVENIDDTELFAIQVEFKK